MTTRVIVADDQDLVRTGLSMILNAQADIEVVGEAANGVDAVDLAQRLRPDVCLLDIGMPRMDGIEATQAIRQSENDTGRRTEIIAVTANVSQETRLKCRRVGMNGYLEKPITASVIKDQLIRSWPRVRTHRKS